jgi:hypothetical protein
MPVMDIRKVRMSVTELHVPVRVTMRLSWRIAGSVQMVIGGAGFHGYQFRRFGGDRVHPELLAS